MNFLVYISSNPYVDENVEWPCFYNVMGQEFKEVNEEMVIAKQLACDLITSVYNAHHDEPLQQHKIKVLRTPGRIIYYSLQCEGRKTIDVAIDGTWANVPLQDTGLHNNVVYSRWRMNTSWGPGDISFDDLFRVYSVCSDRFVTGKMIETYTSVNDSFYVHQTDDEIQREHDTIQALCSRYRDRPGAIQFPTSYTYSDFVTINVISIVNIATYEQFNDIRTKLLQKDCVE